MAAGQFTIIAPCFDFFVPVPIVLLNLCLDANLESIKAGLQQCCGTGTGIAGTVTFYCLIAEAEQEFFQDQVPEQNLDPDVT